MATYLEYFNLRYTDANLKDKATTAISFKAYAVLGEDPGTSNHANRLIWANRVLTGQESISEAEKFMWPMLYIGIDGNSADGDISSAVSSLVDLFATGE